MNNPSSFVQWSLFFQCFLPPLAEVSSNKSAGSESFVVSLQTRNQFSKPSTEMELIQWPRVARSTTCEKDRRPASKIDVCVILHIFSWRYGRIVTLFWCINDDYNLCVCDFAYLIMKIWPHCNLVLMYQWWL
jgi:hypothetical protein